MELVLPSIEFRKNYVEALVEYHAEGRYLDRTAGNFEAVVTRLLAMDDPAHIMPGFVPQTTFWLVDDATYLGRLSLRHRLNADLHRSAGNIGYEIRPSRRGEGLGTRILALGLDKARSIGLPRVLLTCYEDNLPSIRVIEANGGVRDTDHLVPGTTMVERRYWIEW